MNSQHLPWTTSNCSRINTYPSQVFSLWSGDKVIHITLDSGATVSFITKLECDRLNLKINKASQLATQADGQTRMHVLGEVKETFSRGKTQFNLHALVVDKLCHATILGGMNFLIENQIDQQPAKHRIVVKDKFYIEETLPEASLENNKPTIPVKIPKSAKCIFPGQTLKLNVDDQNITPNGNYMICPDQSNKNNSWLLQETELVNRTISIANNTKEPIIFGTKQDAHIIKLRPITYQDNTHVQHMITNFNPKQEFNKQESTLSYIQRINKLNQTEVSRPPQQNHQDILKDIYIESNVMNEHENKQCQEILTKNIDVFNDDVSEGYNNFSGELDVDWNWLNNQLPPPNIMKHPTYSNTKMKILLQEKIDFMESQNICMKAHMLGAPIQYASLPMLVAKSSLKSVKGEPTHINYRFVTLFNKLNEYIALEPSQPDSIEETLYDVGQWKYIIVGDLSNSFHQRWIAKNKLPWMAFPSPYKGMYVLLRSGQGMKNQSEGLQHNMRMILGELIQQGKARIIADDIQTGGSTISEALQNWNLILQACQRNNIKIDPKKTKIFAKKINLLGWSKQSDYLHADAHRILSIQKADFPSTVSDMRSYLGSYKTFFKAMPEMAQLLHPLEQVTGEKDGKSKIDWTPDLSKSFKLSQQSIVNVSPLYQPKRDEQLLITLDWSKKGIGATLYAVQENKKKVVEYFSAKLKGNQINWPPCDGEGLALATALKRFSHFLRESSLPTIVASDNKTVIQALNLMATGSFSTSPRLNALLASINIYPLKFRHISGKFKLNEDSDASSRQPMECSDSQCSVCTFISNQAEILDKPHSGTSIRHVQMLPTPDLCGDQCHHNQFVHEHIKTEQNKSVNIESVMDGSASLPFLSYKYISQLQQDDSVLVKLKTYLTSGARPRKMDNKNNEVKHLLTLNPKINTEGLTLVEITIKGRKSVVEESSI